MKKFPLLRTLSLISALLIAACSTTRASSFSMSQEESSFESTSKEEGSSESAKSLEPSSSLNDTSSSSLEDISSSSSQEASSSMTGSSKSSSSSASSSEASSSSSVSSSSEMSSSSSSVNSPSSSSSSTNASSQQSSSSESSSSSYSNSSSSSSSSSEVPPTIDPLADYQTIATFSKRMPGEFEPCAMVKMCYPNNMPLSAYKAIAEDNKVLLLVNPDNSNRSRITEARNNLSTAGVNLNNVTFLDLPIDNDYQYWVRDFSPFYVFNNQDLSIVDFTYNRPARTEQNAVPSKLASYFNISYSKMDLTHTGGNLMQDGRGTAFSDDLVIDENSNSSVKVKTLMSLYTGTSKYVITIDPQGDYIAHIDCWGKIVAPDKIIVARLPKSNARYQYYEQVANELANTKCAYGYNYRIYRIDEPGGDVVAPYTNSLIANNHVYMPLGSNSSYNEKALQVYREALPGYDIQGIQGFNANHDCAFLNTDALHCRTHEVPDQNMVFIDSREVYHDEVALQDHYVIKANIVSYAKEAIKDVRIHYSINGGNFIDEAMNQYLETSNYTFVFDNLNTGDEVRYYIDAKDHQNNYNIDPTCGSLDPHHFVIA